MAMHIGTILRSPTLFAIHILGIKPFPYQAEILEDDSEQIVIVAGRQSGKSMTLAIKALWTAFVKPNEDILILAPTQKQAQIIYDVIYGMISKSDLFKGHIKKFTMSETIFDNESHIRCLTVGKSGTFARGYSATMLIFDEAAFIPEEVFVSLEPAFAVRGKQMILSSTPYGKRGFFWQIYSQHLLNKDSKTKVHRFKSEENRILKKDFLIQERQRMTEVQFRQEYEAEFIDEVGLYFPIELVMRCAQDYEYGFPTEKEEGTRLIVGVDVARVGEDETAFVVVQKVPDGISKVIYAETHSQFKITDTAQFILRWLNTYSIDMVFIDMTGVGAGVVDILEQNFSHKVKGITFTAQSKSDMYSSIKIAMETNKLVVNRADTKFLYQFSGFTGKYDITGKLRITKSEIEHDDLVDALALTFSDDALYNVMPISNFNDYLNADKSKEDIVKWEVLKWTGDNTW